MEETKEKLIRLLDKETLSAEEKDWLLNYIENTGQQELKDIMQAGFENDLAIAKPLNPFLSQRILHDIHTKIEAQTAMRNSVIPIWAKRFVAAAAVIAIIAYCAYRYTGPGKADRIVQNHPHHHVFKNDVAPGTEKATLTLANGQKITLDDIKNGTIINQGNAEVVKTNGKLAYNAANHTDTVAYNTLFTPRAGRYRLALPDGTQVWLNAASSIRYPTAFAGKDRRVEITGEAYFEVAKNKAKPFIVKVNSSEIRVYGTHFNVMAYNDESAVKTTLLEGSVKCTSGMASCMLKPGEQSELNKDGQFKVTARPNADDEVAWKNGFFHFNNVGMDVIMRQLTREYDITVVYNIPVTDHFYADIPLKSPLSEVLRALELTGKVSFDIRGRQVIVNP